MNNAKWNTMNDLQTVTAKICSAREILSSAIDKFQDQQYDKAETLLFAVDEFLQYYLEEFDEKFKDAWKANIVKQQKTKDYIHHFPVEKMENGLTGQTEYFIKFPKDILEAANILPGDYVEMVDTDDDSFIMLQRSGM